MATFTLFGDIKRIVRTPNLADEGVTAIFGDVKLDLTRTSLAPGYHTLRLITIFGDVKLRVPEHIGLEIDAATVFSDVEVETPSSGDEENPGTHWVSGNFEQAAVQVCIQVYSVFGDVDILRMPVALNANSAAMAQLPNVTRSGPENLSAYEGETINLHRHE